MCMQEVGIMFLLVASTLFLEDLEHHQPLEDLDVLENPDEKEGKGINTTYTAAYACVFMHGCACVTEREREGLNRGKK